MLPRGWSLIYIDFDNGAQRCLIGAQLIKQQQLRGELRNMQMRNEILMDFLCQWFDYKGSDLGSLSISHWAVFTEYPPHPSPPRSLPQHCFIPLLCWKYLVTNIPVQFHQSSCETFLATSHLQISWQFSTTNMSKCLNIFEKSYRNPATFNFRRWKYLGSHVTSVNIYSSLTLK